MKSHSVSSSPPTSANSSPLARLRRKLSPRKSHDKPPPTTVNNSTSAPDVVDDNNDLRWVFNYFDEMEMERYLLPSCSPALPLLEVSFPSRKLMPPSGSVSEEEKTEDLRQAFGLYENEPGSGFITHTSLKRVLSRLGESRSINDCKAIIRTFDLNGDGVLSFNEFSVMMR
ncbi:hypothetical protein DKX38_001773 [Salix brachista]|uniref:EF-hand domain-containing protein n=1 Tax=Salix brachista TaxID=2182728 RepID=A0A5N5NK91_9ROSI|nr:hypothetical protein DKX38_001773 [Salix brachista]